jgi:hypothetical protein
LSDVATVNIDVTNINDNTPVIDDGTGSVPENALTGALVATIS